MDKLKRLIKPEREVICWRKENKSKCCDCGKLVIGSSYYIEKSKTTVGEVKKKSTEVLLEEILGQDLRSFTTSILFPFFL